MVASHDVKELKPQSLSDLQCAHTGTPSSRWPAVLQPHAAQPEHCLGHAGQGVSEP